MIHRYAEVLFGSTHRNSKLIQNSTGVISIILRTEGSASLRSSGGCSSHRLYSARVRPEEPLMHGHVLFHSWVVGCLFYSSSLRVQTHFIYIIYMYYIYYYVLSVYTKQRKKT